MLLCIFGAVGIDEGPYKKQSSNITFVKNARKEEDMQFKSSTIINHGDDVVDAVHPRFNNQRRSINLQKLVPHAKEIDVGCISFTHESQNDTLHYQGQGSELLSPSEGRTVNLIDGLERNRVESKSNKKRTNKIGCVQS